MLKFWTSERQGRCVFGLSKMAAELVRSDVKFFDEGLHSISVLHQDYLELGCSSRTIVRAWQYSSVCARVCVGALLSST